MERRVVEMFRNSNYTRAVLVEPKTVKAACSRTFFGGRTLAFAVRGPGARTRGVVVYETGRTRHFVGNALHAIDELVANAFVPVSVVTVGPGTALGRFRFLCFGFKRAIITITGNIGGWVRIGVG